MPPSMSAHGYDTPDLTKDDLTDEAIETLYDIVRRAQSSPDKSSRAVFTAYEEVLAEQGLSPSDDAVLHRFLFRMQKNRRKDENLTQRFKRVLHESFGIDVEIDEDGEGIEVTTNLDATRNRAQNSLGRHSRRGSFDSFFDGTADKVAGTVHGDLPIRARRGSQRGAPNGDQSSKRRTRSDTEAHSYHQVQLADRSRMNGHAHQRSLSGQHQLNRKRSGSVSSRGSLQIRRDGQTETSRAGDNEADDSEYTDRTTSLDLSHVQIPGVNAPIPDDQHDSSHHHQPQQYAPEPWQPSDTRLMDEAELFEQQRLHRVTRDCIQIWRNRTQERMSIRDDMEKLAIAFDRRILLKLSFEQLRDTVQVKRSGKETDRFFTRLESRADKARNLFLLTKAFTHWAKSAEDEVQRTSVARRHILRTRFFNGWRDITAVNELKIQHFVLGKFLQQWRARTAIVRENSQSAVLLYEENLVRRLYKEWFFRFCAIAAPAWRSDRTRRVTLQKWSEIAKVLRERENWATDRRDRTVLRKTFQSWQHRTTSVQSQQTQANGFRQTALLTTALRTYEKQTQLAPLLRQFQARVYGRIVRTAFQTWRRDSQLARQARNVDQMRILRNAWTAWNDQLRIKALEDRINDRVIIESLYRWTLASRVSLFQRVHDRQLKESIFLTWVTKTNQRANTLDAAERRFAQFKRAQRLRMCLRKMEATTAEKRAEEFAVIAEYQQKLKQKVFAKLKEKQEHFQQLNHWSADARFYVLGKRTLKTWTEATQYARRNRRRDTYAQIRRTMKANLVRRLFEHWRDKANHIAMQHQQANDIHENRILQGSGALLHQWHDRTITLRQQDVQATNAYSFKLESRIFNTWSQRTQNLRTMATQAVALRQESTEIAATSALKKLGWRLWNIQRQKKNAQALYERNFEKHVRAMIRFWFEQTAEKLANRPVSPTPRSRSRGGRRDHDGGSEGHAGSRDGGLDDEDRTSDNAGDETHHLEAWTAFDETALGLDNDLDLSLSMTPKHQNPALAPSAPPPPSVSRPPPQLHPPSVLRPTATRPNTYPQPQSSLRPPPPTIPEHADLDEDFADPSTFWSGTPMPPPPTGSKPGYLKTPSKRSVVRAKRPELPASPEKRAVSPVRSRPLGLDGGGRGLVERERERGMESMSAPPVRASRDTGFGGGAGGVTSFERRLQEGGFANSVAGGSAFGGGRGRGGKGKGRVGFGDVREMG